MAMRLQKKYSPYQQDAAEYFDSVMEELGVTDANNVYVTGHSKGGNQAQFVTLASKNAYLVDKCISMDGEGFSPEAIAYFKMIYGEDFYEGQLQKNVRCVWRQRLCKCFWNKGDP